MAGFTDVRASVTGYVLAGGLSHRMGRDKALLEVDGEPLVEHALRKLLAVCDQAKVLSGPPDFARDAVLSCYGHLVPDSTERCGPVGGLLAALADCCTGYALILSVDQPGMPVRALHRLVHDGLASGAAAVCFRAQWGVEPLPLLISTELRDPLARAARSGELRLMRAVEECADPVRGELLTVDVSGQPGAEGWFQNLNTPEDLEQWKAQSNQSDPNASE